MSDPQVSTPPAPSPAASPALAPRDYAYYHAIFQNHPMPFAFLDRDLLDANIRLIASRAGGKRIRIASKSVRSVAVLRHILAADPCFQGIMCFTAHEAAFLAQQGFDDLLIGYPMFNAQDLAVVAQATQAGAHITLMVDSPAHIDQIERVALAHGVRLPVCIEMDMSLNLPGLRFGVWRSPIHTAEQARSVIERIQSAQAVYLDGIMGYEAQVAGLGDNLPGAFAKNSLVRLLKQRSIHEAAERREALVQLINAAGIQLRFVNGGGTGSLASTRTEPLVTEVTVGSGFLTRQGCLIIIALSATSPPPDSPSNRAPAKPWPFYLPGWGLLRLWCGWPRKTTIGLPAHSRTLEPLKAQARCKPPFAIMALRSCS